ncbi:glucan endo-1,3-beta-glucosidase 8-like [Salvia miltiorrhiza]|uniref:glucan endo-1,3-beta-glucosidase 8-like n=1 Tax=Salvia miltiorrhiza TaxID=226208 RepID=UPI0025ABD31E|nr:glucan endo-1,3-beta-glucosidase 8-like [Salvia miltiorrhiza]
MKKPTWVVAAMVAAVAVAQVVGVAEGLGVNWGNQAAQNLHPRVIVQMLKDNNINKVKLFDSDAWVVKHFAGTGIEVMLGIPNLHLASLADRYKHAKAWVKANLTRHIHEGGVDIKYVAVGNEPFLKAYNGSNLQTTYPALWNIQKAINEAGLGDRIKATIPQNADVYDSGSKGPSNGDFRADIRATMKQIVQFLRDNNAPFVVNVYPFLSLSLNPDFPVEYAFFSGGAQPVQDGGITYTNVLDANLDTLLWSLRKAGCGDVPIIVGEIGWPTDGDKYATVDMAKKFYDGFFKKLSTTKGTPLYKKSIEYYLFGLTDENLKSVAPGDFERHWGVFRYDGQPKFPVDFTGHGSNKMPVGAKYVKYLERKWCVYVDNGASTDEVSSSMNYACTLGDCTALNYGGPCSKLDNSSKFSYAFNMLFQMSYQDVETCDYGGIAKIVTKNATVGNCLFPIALDTDWAWRVGAQLKSTLLTGLLLSLLLLGL